MCIVPVIEKLLVHYPLFSSNPLSLSTFIYFPTPTPVAPLAGKKLGFTTDCGKLHNISLGQGQEIVAEKAIEKAAKLGHWVILQVSVKQYN